MSDLKAKMHQNRFRLRLRLRPARGAYSAPPDPIAGFKAPTSKGRGMTLSHISNGENVLLPIAKCDRESEKLIFR